MSYVYCAYMSFCDVVAPMRADTHHVGEGHFLLVSTGRIYAFFATVIEVTVGPEVLQGKWGRRLGTSTAPTGAAASAAVASIIWSVGEI